MLLPIYFISEAGESVKTRPCVVSSQRYGLEIIGDDNAWAFLVWTYEFYILFFGKITLLAFCVVTLCMNSRSEKNILKIARADE